MQLCLEQVPPDHPEAMEGGNWTSRIHPALDWDHNNRVHQESTMVATTAWMDNFVADCLNRVPQPAPQDERDMIYDTCFSLFTLVAGTPDSAFHTPLQQQQECMDRARWRVFHSRPPIMAIAEAKWRHWKPGRLKEESATTQRKLELHLRDRWADRIIGLLLPFAKDIPYLHAVNGENVHQEYLDLLGDTRFRALRIHCLCFENIQKLGFNTIPWKESDIRSLLNTLRDQEITPHKLQGIWNTLRWFSARFGLLDPDSLERLKAKRKTIQEGLVETNIKPQRKAQLPSKEVIMLLEKVASGAGLTGPLTAKNTLDRYICAIARFQVACSARFNDLQHTSPGGYKLTETTLELQAWQTKTVSAFRIKKNPVPLIAPLYTFTGMDWWSILPQAWDRLVAQEKFKDMDYLIPTVSSDFTGLIPRPGQADRTLRWLKDALHPQNALDASTFKHLSWHSFRVFIPDCAYQLGMPRDQRQYPPRARLTSTPGKRGKWSNVLGRQSRTNWGNWTCQVQSLCPLTWTTKTGTQRSWNWTPLHPGTVQTNWDPPHRNPGDKHWQKSQRYPQSLQRGVGRRYPAHPDCQRSPNRGLPYGWLVHRKPTDPRVL